MALHIIESTVAPSSAPTKVGQHYINTVSGISYISIGTATVADWEATGASGSSPLTTKGDIYVYSTTNTRLPVGTNGYILSANSAQATGLEWIVAPVGYVDPMTTRGDLVYRNASNVTARLPVGTAGYILTSDGTDVSWAANVALVDPMTTRGDIIVRNASNVTARLGVGTNGQVIGSDGTDISWTTPTVYADRQLSNLTGTVAIPNGVHILPATTLQVNLGSSTKTFSDIYSDSIYVVNSSTVKGLLRASNLAMPSGASVSTHLSGIATYNLGILTSTTSGASTNSANLYIETGNASGTTSNSGSMVFTIGTATGTQGVFKFLKGGTTTTIGYVWTASATDGTGYWAAASSGFSDPMTTRGDLIYRNASNVTARLPIGANTYVLTSDGTDVSWAAAASGSGDVVGPASATSTAIALYDGTTGKLIKNSIVLIDVSGNMTGANTFAFQQARLDSTTPSTWGAPIHGLISNQATVDGTFGLASVDHANNSTDVATYLFLGTGSKPGASSTGKTGPMYGYTGNNAGSGDSGEIFYQTGQTNTGTSGYIQWDTGTSSAGSSGPIYFTTGNAAVNSGSQVFLIGTAGTAQGTFRFHKVGTTVGVGDVWKATHSDGRGYWAAPTWLTDPMTTRGDLIYRNASNVTARLPVGAAGYVLTSDGTDVSWAAATGGGGTVQFSWNFDDTDITETAPANKDFKANNATWASVTEFYFDDNILSGADSSNILGLLTAGDKLYVQQLDDATKYGLFTVVAAVDNTGWWSIEVTVDNVGTIPANNKDCGIILAKGGTSSHAGLTSLSWTSSGHTGTATRLAGFNGSNVASLYTMSGTGTEVALTNGATLVAPILGTPASGNLSNCTAYPSANIDHDATTNFVANEHIDHTTVTLTAGTGLSGGGDISANRTFNLANTAVTPASYGSASSVATFTVDAQGRLTAAASVAIAIAAGAVSGLATVATSGSHLDLSNIGTNSHSTIDTHLANNNIHVPSMTAGSVMFHNGTSLAQDNATFFWDTTNKRLGLGVGAASNTLTINGTVYGAVSTVGADGTSDVLLSALHRHSSTAAIGAFSVHARSRGASGAETVVSNGDVLGAVYFVGHDGTDYANGAAIVASVSGTPGANDMPTQLAFQTSPDGSQTLTTAMTISSAQVVNFVNHPTGLITTSVDNSVPRFDSTAGRLQSSSVIVGDVDGAGLSEVSGIGKLNIRSTSYAGDISSTAWGMAGIKVTGGAATLTDTSTAAGATVAAGTTVVLSSGTIASTNGTVPSPVTYTHYYGAYAYQPTSNGTTTILTNKWAIGADSMRMGMTNFVEVTTAGKFQMPQTGNVGASDQAAMFVSGPVGITVANTVTPPAIRVDTIYTTDGTGYGSIFGAGFLFWNKQQYNDNTAASGHGALYGLVSQPVFRADVAGCTQSAHIDFYSEPSYTISGSGTSTVTQTTGFHSRCVVNTGQTITRRVGYEFFESTGTNTTLTNIVAYCTAAITKGTNYAHIQLGSTSNLSGIFAINSQVAQACNWSGAQRYARRTSAATTITVSAASDHIIVCSHTSNQTVNLPAASTCTNMYLIIKKSASGGVVTVDASGAETIDGATTQPLSAQYETMELFCDGTTWHLVHLGAP